MAAFLALTLRGPLCCHFLCDGSAPARLRIDLCCQPLRCNQAIALVVRGQNAIPIEPGAVEMEADPTLVANVGRQKKRSGLHSTSTACAPSGALTHSEGRPPA